MGRVCGAGRWEIPEPIELLHKTKFKKILPSNMFLLGINKWSTQQNSPTQVHYCTKKCSCDAENSGKAFPNTTFGTTV